ncbi:MAG TPA: outer membrane beta-barrel protein, partial [Pseudomonadales bacterium]|nr:outer membrane beta-barrel protein [Pseudomonadales bacterium]
QNYTNNERPVAFGTDPQDTAENEVRETAYLKVMPKTSVLLEARQKNITYDHSYNALTAQGAGPTMDSDETKVYVGAEWEATAKTTGAIRLGHLDKDFVEPNGVVSHPDSYSIPSWESDITWRPRTYSNFVLSTARGFVDSANTGSVIDETRLSLTWNHEWSSVIGSKVYALRLQDDYKSPAINEREDTVTKLGAGTYYKLNKRAKLYADYVFTDRDSNENRFDYNRNLFIIGAKVDFN